MDEVFRALRAQWLYASRRLGRLRGARQGAGDGCPQAPYNPLPLLYAVAR